MTQIQLNNAWVAPRDRRRALRVGVWYGTRVSTPRSCVAGMWPLLLSGPLLPVHDADGCFHCARPFPLNPKSFGGVEKPAPSIERNQSRQAYK